MIVVAVVEVKIPAATLPTVAVSVITAPAVIVWPVVVTLPVEDVMDTLPPVDVAAAPSVAFSFDDTATAPPAFNSSASTLPTVLVSVIVPANALTLPTPAVATTSPADEVTDTLPVVAATAAPSVAVPVDVTVTPVPPVTAPLSAVVPPEVIVVAVVEVKIPAATLPTVAASAIAAPAVTVWPVVTTSPVEDVTDTAPPVEVRA